MTKRFIGVAHRVKVIVKKGEPAESKPTKVCIRENNKARAFELETETDELDFILGRYPVKLRKVADDEDIGEFPAHQVKWRTTEEGEELSGRHESQVKRDKKGKAISVATDVPAKFDGLREDDAIGFVLSGSGNRLAYAASRRAEEIGATAFHLPGFKLRQWRPDNMKDKTDSDHELMAELLETAPAEFYQLEPRDRDLVAQREAYTARIQAMKARMATDLRLRAHFMGQVFCNPDGRYPEGTIELAYEAMRANDAIYMAVEAEEKKREKELKKATEKLEVFQRLFASIEGLGWSIASRIIAVIGDIRQFETDAKLKAYCGVHVLPDGRFPRRRNNELANWRPDCRQAMYLLGDQFNRRPDSVWGKKLREYKAKFRETHPYPVVVVKGKGEVPDRLYELVPDLYEHDKKTGVYTIQTDDGEVKVKGVKRYGNGHIHRMATWRTLTKFVEWLHREWWKLEREFAKKREAGSEVLDLAANE